MTSDHKVINNIPDWFSKFLSASTDSVVFHEKLNVFMTLNGFPEKNAFCSTVRFKIRQM